ncbi:MAG: tetratricopeptide repeat protein [Deltaproteobacteria bacterium]|nr:tetratricopeptide repeat protein [Deltaproteobacteria bacterium]
MGKVACWSMTLCVSLSLGRVAHGQTSVASALPTAARTELAQTHFRTGMQYFDLRRFADAAVEFERVFEFTGQTELLYNIARSHEEAGNVRRAVETYERFQQALPSGFDAVTIRARVEALRSRLPSETQPTAEAPRCVPEAPSAQETPRETPRERVIAPIAAPAPPLLQLRTRVQFERSAFAEVGPWIAVSAGAVLGGFSVWQSLNAQQMITRIDQANRGQGTWTLETQRAYESAPTTSALAWGLGAGAATLLSAGIVWLLARGPGERREMVVAAVPTASGAALVIGGRL